MKLTSIFLISVFFLSSCSMDWNGEKDAKLVELQAKVNSLQTQRDNDLFAKKESCLRKYKETWDIGNQQTYDNLSLDVFYSAKENTCIIALDGWYKKDKTRVFLIGDLFSLNVISSFSVDKDWKIMTKKDIKGGTLNELKCDFNKTISEFKGFGYEYFTVDCAK